MNTNHQPRPRAPGATEGDGGVMEERRGDDDILKDIIRIVMGYVTCSPLK